MEYITKRFNIDYRFNFLFKFSFLMSFIYKSIILEFNIFDLISFNLNKRKQNLKGSYGYGETEILLHIYLNILGIRFSYTIKKF